MELSALQLQPTRRERRVIKNTALECEIKDRRLFYSELTVFVFLISTFLKAFTLVKLSLLESDVLHVIYYYFFIIRPSCGIRFLKSDVM